MAAGITLSDVAREAGVSLATASRAINGSANRSVGAELRARVLATAERLRYTPDANAQAMARGRTTSVGLVVHDIADPYFSAIAAGVTRAADAAGLQVTLVSTQHEAHREVELVRLLQSQRARAIILAGGRLVDEAALDALRDALAEYRATGGTVAVVGPAELGVATVAIENAEGAGALARELHGLGYRRPAVLAGPPDHRTARTRTGAFLAACAESGVTVGPDAVRASAFTHEGGEQAMRDLIASGADVDVVFAVNDVMALGALAAARDLGIRVPEDLALAGFDDIATLRDVTPGLTTVHVPLTDVGATAVELALAEPGKEPEVRVAATHVVLRESTERRSATATASEPV